jgi:hypothetical protein
MPDFRPCRYRSKLKSFFRFNFPGVLLLLILTSLLAGCSGPGSTVQNNSPTSSSTTPVVSTQSVDNSSLPTGQNPATSPSSSAVTSLPATSLSGDGSGNSLTVISSITGTVSVLVPPSNEWTIGKVGMVLIKENSLKTEIASGATVSFFDGSTIEIHESTEIKIVDLTVNPTTGTTTTLLNQKIGQTISRLNKLVDSSSRYEIETPAAVAAVRGTTMQVTVAADGSTTVANIEGSVSVTAQGKEVMVPPGQHSFTVPGQAPGPPQPGLDSTLFDQQRAAIIFYMQAWWRADAPISQVLGSIELPAELTDATRAEISSSVNSALAAIQAGLPNVELLTAPDIDSVKTHLQTYKQLREEELANEQALLKAVLDNSQSEYAQAMVDTNSIYQRTDALNQLIDSIMTDYSILESDIPA